MQKYKNMCIVCVFSNIVSLNLGIKKAWATASEKVELCFRPTDAQGPEELLVNK